jgi:hypothetical protein
MEKAVADGDSDTAGLGRPAVLDLTPRNGIVINPEINQQNAVLHRKENKSPWVAKRLGITAVGKWTGYVAIPFG